MSDLVRVHEGERLRRWRMVLGAGETEDGDGIGVDLEGDDRRMDAALSALYDAPPAGSDRGRRGRRGGGLGGSAPAVAKWLGDIRTYFPSAVVQVMQRDAIDRLNLHRMLLEPELLESVEPDIHLVTMLLALSHLLPDTTRATARSVVEKVVADLQERLSHPTAQALRGALARANRTRRPQPGDIDWNRTIRANLGNYQRSLRTVIPERLIGYTRRTSSLRHEVIIAIDQSASMSDSVVYASVFGAALASVRAVKTRLIAFDTAVADLTEHMHDPVDVLFGIQLGGGTDINRAMAYCDSQITQPADTVLILISDLYEGAPGGDFVSRIAAMARRGVTCIALLALSDEGAPAFDHGAASALAEIGVPAFACTPAAFPDLLAAAINHADISQWAGDHGLVTRAAGGGAGGVGGGGGRGQSRA